MSHESRQAIIRAEEQLKQLGKELELDRYLRVDDDPYPSKRVFKLLKNLDLENVSFSNVQSAGNPMHIEKLNRQELFDLVLVNFARLCVDGEWEGLLTGGGGGGTQYAFEPIDASLLVSTYRRFSPTDVYRLQSTTTVGTSMDEKALFMRFVVPKDGTMDEITIRTAGTNTGKDDVWIGIYESSSGLPTNRIGDITIDINGGRRSVFIFSLEHRTRIDCRCHHLDRVRSRRRINTHYNHRELQSISFSGPYSLSRHCLLYAV